MTFEVRDSLNLISGCACKSRRIAMVSSSAPEMRSLRFVRSVGVVVMNKCSVQDHAARRSVLRLLFSSMKIRAAASMSIRFSSWVCCE